MGLVLARSWSGSFLQATIARAWSKRNNRHKLGYPFHQSGRRSSDALNKGESASQVSDERLRVAHPLSALGLAHSHPHPSRGQIQAPPTQSNLSALQLRPSTCGAEKPFFTPPPPLSFLVFCAAGVFGLTLCSCCTVSLSCQLRFEASFALLYEWRRAGLLGHGGDVRPPATRDCTRHCIES